MLSTSKIRPRASFAILEKPSGARGGRDLFPQGNGDDPFSFHSGKRKRSDLFVTRRECALKGGINQFSARCEIRGSADTSNRSPSNREKYIHASIYRYTRVYRELSQISAEACARQRRLEQNVSFIAEKCLGTYRRSPKDTNESRERGEEGGRWLFEGPAHVRVLQVSRGLVARATPAEISAFTFREMAMYPSPPAFPPLT